MNTDHNSKQTTCLCRDTGGKGTLPAQRTGFNTLGNWGLKTPTQSKRKRTGKKRLKGHGPKHVYNTLGYIFKTVFSFLVLRKDNSLSESFGKISWNVFDTKPVSSHSFCQTSQAKETAILVGNCKTTFTFSKFGLFFKEQTELFYRQTVEEVKWLDWNSNLIQCWRN